MSKIDLSPINSGYNITPVNDNFNKITQALQDEVLYRNNPNSEPNQMEQEFDMNGFHILNSPRPVAPTHLVRLQDLTEGDLSSASYDSVARAKASVFTGGEVIRTKSYYDDGPEDNSGAAFYLVVPILEYTGIPDEFGDHTTDDGEFVLKLEHNGVLRAKQFGAKGDGGINASADDTAALQAMINAGTSTSVLECYPMYCEKGIYEVTAKLVAPESARFTLFSDSRSGAARIRVNETLVPVGTPLDSVFEFTTPSAIHIYNIAVWGSERAVTLFDGLQDQQGQGFGFRNTTFDHVQMHGVRSGGTAINGVSWNTDITFCDIAGYGNVDSPTTWLGTGIQIAQASNGCNIMNNYIRRLDIGITNSAAGSNDLVNIKYNTFDKLNLCGIYLFRSTRKVSICNNYWEGVVDPGSPGIDVPTSSGTTNVSACVIIATPTTDTVGGIAQSVTITDNNYIAGYSDSIIAVSGIFRGDILRNTVRYRGGATTEKHNEFVRVFGYGTFTSSRFQRSLLLDGNDLWKERSPSFEPSVEKIITFETDLTSVNWRYFEGVVVKDSITAETYNLTTLFDESFLTLNDLNSRYNTVWHNTEKDIIRVEKNVGGTTVPMNFNRHLDKVRGTYVRVEMESLSDFDGVRPRLRFDDGVNVTYVEGSDGTFVTDTDDSTFGYASFPIFIDENATKLEIEYSTLGGDGTVMYFKNINVVPIYMDLRTAPTFTEVRKREVPTTGYWNRGDFIRNRLFESDIVYGWVCVTSGEPGVWEAVSTSAQALNDEVPVGFFGARNLIESDRGKTLVGRSDSTDNIVTIPVGSTVPINGQVALVQEGDATAGFQAAAGVEINEIDGGLASTDGKWGGIVITKYDVDKWRVQGGSVA